LKKNLNILFLGLFLLFFKYIPLVSMQDVYGDDTPVEVITPYSFYLSLPRVSIIDGSTLEVGGVSVSVKPIEVISDFGSAPPNLHTNLKNLTPIENFFNQNTKLDFDKHYKRQAHKKNANDFANKFSQEYQNLMDTCNHHRLKSPVSNYGDFVFQQYNSY
jgi:hypothetical protein